MSHDPAQNGEGPSCCTPKNRTDWLLIGSSIIIVAGYALHLFNPGGLAELPYVMPFAHSIFEFMNTIWWGVLLGILVVGVLAGVPQSLVRSVMGKGGTINGVIRSTFGGLVLDLCSHGILLVGMQLYKRGASLGQVMAFLIASPWNSLSLTFILWSLVGLKWTLMLLVLSMIIAIISGIIFDQLVKRGVLPPNPHATDEVHAGWKQELHTYLSGIRWHPQTLLRTGKKGFSESAMILRWIFFGVVLAAVLRTFIPADLFSQLFGPTIFGLGATLLFATVLEVCSEGSMPVAADFLLRANAPGNMFAFLMAGVSSDYTEILSIRQTTGSWKIAFFLPLVTFPQVALLGWILNMYG